MKSLILVTAALLLSATVANAETFTFTGKSTQGMSVGAPGPGGKLVVGATAKIETDLVWASGAKSHSTGNCVAWSAPLGSGASTNGVCYSTDADGSKSGMFFTCIADEKNEQSDCWGRVVYETGPSGGKNQGKVSTVSWHGHTNADGKGGTAVGAGNMS